MQTEENTKCNALLEKRKRNINIRARVFGRERDKREETRTVHF